ncbi:MAG: LysM peptidoglycan-binding domain-containing protein [Candidatus Omnitrophica bacterium]|nr:LysM peptidoglycan-binding domain-containing protein [Candidatus Omnitrophota bacterium]
MERMKLAGICILTSSLALSGCVARTYNLTRDRLDQDISAASGNRGYIMGAAPAETSKRKTTRTTRVFEIELGRTKPLQQRVPPVMPSSNIMPGASVMDMEETIILQEEPIAETMDQSFESYTVGKNDTLQKISKKFYGTTRKWPKIYEANKDILRSPDKLYAGQTLKIPSGPGMKAKSATMMEPKENLK